MANCRIYHFEDVPRKRAAFREVLALLDKAGKAHDVVFSDILGHEYSAGIEESAPQLADAAERALADPEGLILLDLRLTPEAYFEAAVLLENRFIAKVPSLKDKTALVIGELPWMINMSTFAFASVVLALSKHFQRKLFI